MWTGLFITIIAVNLLCAAVNYKSGSYRVAMFSCYSAGFVYGGPQKLDRRLSYS